MAKTRSGRPTSALSDHAKVRGVRKGRANQKKGARRQAALQRARTVGSVLAAVLGVGGLGYGAVKLSRWAETSPRFAIEQIEVTGFERAREATLRRLLAVEPGDNLVAVDADAMKEALEAHPWVAEARVDKRYPRGLRVEVVEHRPVALVALEHLYYADATGEIVKRYAPGEAARLPVITGLSRADVERADPVAQAQLFEALTFLEVFAAHQGEDAQAVAEVNVDPVMGLSFVLEEDEARVELGHAPFEAKLDRWVTAKQTLAARGVSVSRISLSGKRAERVVARLEARPARARAARDAQPKSAARGATVVAAGPGGAP